MLTREKNKLERSLRYPHELPSAVWVVDTNKGAHRRR